MTGIVLAGGESRRMGTDKAFLRFKGLPMVEHVILTLRAVCGHVIVVTNSPARYAGYDVEITGDVLNNRGSLVGLYSGLLCSREEHNLVVACDMPFLNRGLITYLAGLAAGFDVVVPRIGEFFEPLHAVYSRGLLPVMEDHLKRNQLSIRAVFAGRKVRYVTEEEIDRFDPARRSFMNLNTRKEYEEATCSDLECRN